MKEIIGFIICIYFLYKVPIEILDELAFVITAVTLTVWFAEIIGTLIGELFKKIWRKKDG